MWDLTGKQVKFDYIKLYQGTGRITESRVRNDGRVEHTVELPSPIYLMGRMRERLIVKNEEIINQ